MITSRVLHTISGTWAADGLGLEFCLYPPSSIAALRTRQGNGQGAAWDRADPFFNLKVGNGFPFMLVAGMSDCVHGAGWGWANGDGSSNER